MPGSALRPDKSRLETESQANWRHRLDFLRVENWFFEFKNCAIYTWYRDARYAPAESWGRHSTVVVETKYALRPGLQTFGSRVTIPS
jgi:hypothetical protein